MRGGLLATVLFGVLMASGGTAVASLLQPCVDYLGCASDQIPYWTGEYDSFGNYICECRAACPSAPCDASCNNGLDDAGCTIWAKCDAGSVCVPNVGCRVPPTPTPVAATTDSCEGLEGACFGLCNAYCNAIKCQLPDQVNQKPCERVFGNYSDPKHHCPPMPCLQPPEPANMCVEFPMNSFGLFGGLGGYPNFDVCIDPSASLLCQTGSNILGYDFSSCSQQSCEIVSSTPCERRGEKFISARCVKPCGSYQCVETVSNPSPDSCYSDSWAAANQLCSSRGYSGLYGTEGVSACALPGITNVRLGACFNPECTPTSRCELPSIDAPCQVWRTSDSNGCDGYDSCEAGERCTLQGCQLMDEACVPPPPPACEAPTPCVIGVDCDSKCRTYCDCTRTGCPLFDRVSGCTCVECGGS